MITLLLSIGITALTAIVASVLVAASSRSERFDDESDDDGIRGPDFHHSASAPCGLESRSAFMCSGRDIGAEAQSQNPTQSAVLYSIAIPSLMDTFLAAGKAVDACALGLTLAAIIAFYAALWLYLWSKGH